MIHFNKGLSLKGGKTLSERERLYNVWRLMVGRCSGKWTNPFTTSVYANNKIEVCEEWKNNFESFYEWALISGSQPGLELDRINTYGNYEPNNCRFVTHKENCRNKTNTKYVTYKNITKSIPEWSDIYHIPINLIHSRLRSGWTFEDAITKPISKKKRSNRWKLMRELNV